MGSRPFGVEASVEVAARGVVGRIRRALDAGEEIALRAPQRRSGELPEAALQPKVAPSSTWWCESKGVAIHVTALTRRARRVGTPGPSSWST